MSKDKTKSENKLQRRNPTNTNGSIQKKNIFQLIAPINKQRKKVDIKEQDIFLFAENLISFLQLQHPEELDKLKFSENNTVNDLITSLVKTITDLKYIVVYNDDSDTDDMIRILYDIQVGEWKWYLFDTIMIDKIPVEELKIGYAHFLNTLSPYSSHSAIRSEYENTDDTEYEYVFEYMFSEEMTYDENGDHDEGMAQEQFENVRKELSQLRKLKQNFNNYSVEPIEKFIKYIPQNDFEKEFQLFLIKLIGIDYDILNKFHPGSNVYDDGGVDYSDNLLIYFDSDDGNIEEQHFRDMNNNANNGVSEPMGWYSIKKGIVKRETSEQDVETFFNTLHSLEELYHKFLNKL